MGIGFILLCCVAYFLAILKDNRVDEARSAQFMKEHEDDPEYREEF